ncbi:MAG TPA: sugar transferase [Gemmatimonadaceae bacterium]|nr:sugar transferase [Gemmatimonadaceae bacterium]
MDVVLATLGLVLGFPLMVACALLVKVSSRGPVIFEQERIGRFGRPFMIKKFRTMRSESTGLAITSSSDSRITTVGRWLRATKLDELPQLINVIRGQMSLVGPRPEVAKYVALWPADARAEILRVRPGMTDPAAIAFRRESELLAETEDPERYYVEKILPQKVGFYRAYVSECSLLGDFKILLQTASAVAKG